MLFDDKNDFEDSGYWTEKLIQIVRNKPALYDTNLPENSDRNVIANIWIEVCEAVVPGWNEMVASRKSLKVKEIQGKWRNIRTCFRRELQKQNSKSLEGPMRHKRRQYIYFNQLTFLLPTIREREKLTNFKNPSKTLKDNSESEGESFEETFYDECSSVSQTQANYSIQVEEKPQRLVPHTVPEPEPEPSDEHIPVQPTISKATKESELIYREPFYKQNTEDVIDEDKTFLLSLLPTFKRFNYSQKFDAKIEFLQTLKRITQTRQHSSKQMHQFYPNSESDCYEEKYNISEIRPNAYNNIAENSISSLPRREQNQ